MNVNAYLFLYLHNSLLIQMLRKEGNFNSSKPFNAEVDNLFFVK